MVRPERAEGEGAGRTPRTEGLARLRAEEARSSRLVLVVAEGVQRWGSGRLRRRGWQPGRRCWARRRCRWKKPGEVAVVGEAVTGLAPRGVEELPTVEAAAGQVLLMGAVVVAPAELRVLMRGVEEELPCRGREAAAARKS